MVKDKDGKYGLKVHRGLGTTDATEAQRLAEELEKILSDSYWADSSKKEEAYKHFSEVVVDAYYEPLEAANPIHEDSLNQIKLPSKEDGYTRQTFVGPSGAGKTSLLRLMAGTGMEKFIQTIKRFTSNNWRAWGSLLSPIVKTMRVKRRFKPEFCERIPN